MSDPANINIPGECPSAVDIGNAGWTILHTSAVAYPNKPSPVQEEAMRQFILAWSQVYACSWCGFHMRQYVAANPPAVADKNAITRYVCELHNEVNSRLGKDTYDCDPAVQFKRWHPGYPDHMADEPTIEEKLAAAAAKEREKAVKRRMAEEAEQQRIAALGLERPEKRSSAGWRAWVNGGEHAAAKADVARDSGATASHIPDQGGEEAQPATSSAWRGSTQGGTPQQVQGTASSDSANVSEMSPGLMNSLLSRIKGCKVFCPEDAK